GAGGGMALGLVQYVRGRKQVQGGMDRLEKKPRLAAAVASGGSAAGFTAEEWKRMTAIVVFFLVAILFWGAYEQAGSTLNLFADRYTRLEMFGVSFPSSWFQSVQPIFVIRLAPAFAWLWTTLGRREPSVPAKFAIGVLFMGLAFLILVPAGGMAQSGEGVRVSPWWLIASYAISELGELCVSP